MPSSDKIEGHISPITTVDVLSDGNCYASGGYDGLVILWQSDGSIRWHFQAPDLVNQVKFDKEGNRLTATCADSHVYVLDSKNGTILTVIGPHKDDVNAVAWYPDGSALVTVCDTSDPDIHIWDVTTGKHIRSLTGHEGGVFGVCFNPSGTKLATAAEDGTARIWSPDTGMLQVLKHPGDPETIDWSPDGHFIATGCDDRILRLWNPETGKLLATSDAATSRVSLVKFDPSRPELIAGSYDGCIRIHRLTDMTVIRRLEAPFQWERSATFIRDGVMVGSFGSAPIVHSESIEGPSEAGRTFGINTVASRPYHQQSPEGQKGLVVVGRDDGGVVDIETGQPLYLHSSIVNTVVFSHDGNYLASADYLGVIKIWNLSNNSLSAQARLSSGPVNSLAWSPTGDQIVSASYDGFIRWWTPSLELIGEVQGHKGPIKSISWSVAADILVAGSSDDSVSGWHGQKNLYRRTSDKIELVNSVSTSPYHNIFASASRDGLARIWDIITGELVEALPRVHKKSVKAVALASDGQSLLSGSYDGTAVYWTRQDGKWSSVILQLHGKPGVPAVTFDGDTLITAGWDGTAGRWTHEGKLQKHYKLNVMK